MELTGLAASVATARAAGARVTIATVRVQVRGLRLALLMLEYQARCNPPSPTIPRIPLFSRRRHRARAGECGQRATRCGNPLSIFLPFPRLSRPPAHLPPCARASPLPNPPQKPGEDGFDRRIGRLRPDAVLVSCYSGGRGGGWHLIL